MFKYEKNLNFGNVKKKYGMGSGRPKSYGPGGSGTLLLAE
jgi:hypothetical protein